MPFTTSRYRMLAGALLSLLVVVALTVLYKADLHGLDGLDNELGAARRDGRSGTRRRSTSSWWSRWSSRPCR